MRPQHLAPPFSVVPEAVGNVGTWPGVGHALTALTLCCCLRILKTTKQSPANNLPKGSQRYARSLSLRHCVSAISQGQQQQYPGPQLHPGGQQLQPDWDGAMKMEQVGDPSS